MPHRRRWRIRRVWQGEKLHMSGKTRLGVLLLITSALLVGAAGSVGAQARSGSDELEWSLGLGVISSPRPYVGADNQTRVIPLLDLEYRRFYLRGIQAGFRLIEGERFGLDIVGRAQFAGYEEEDSSFLAGMADRRETFELGLAASWKLGSFALEATAGADALGRSDGVQAGLQLTWIRVFDRGRAGLFPSVGFVWQDADFVDYYAGVELEEARPGRPAFEGGSAVNFSAGVRGFVTVADRVRLIGLLQVERLASEFEESPIIDSRWGYFGLLAVAYSF